MNSEKVIPVVASVVLIILIAVVQERSRYLAAILATMPLTAPLAMWIVFSASGGDAQQTADFTISMVAGLLATIGFVVGCWAALKLDWPFPVALFTGMVVWGAMAAGPAVLRLFR